MMKDLGIGADESYETLSREISEQLLKKVKDKLYDLIYIPNSENESILDKILFSVFRSIFLGPIHSKVILVGDKVSEFSIDYSDFDILKDKIDNIYKELTSNKFFTIITLDTLKTRDNSLSILCLIITNKWTGIVHIPLRKMIRPKEGDFYAFTPDMLNDVKVDYTYSWEVHHPANFYYLLGGAIIVA
ncbi:MAG: hypothetical protein QXS19_04370 [Candidatus Methanomethylicia archaeon]